jgi:hypothetical protein
MDQRFEPCLASPLLRFTPKQGQYLALRAVASAAKQWFVGFCQGRPELAVNPLLPARATEPTPVCLEPMQLSEQSGTPRNGIELTACVIGLGRHPLVELSAAGLHPNRCR